MIGVFSRAKEPADNKVRNKIFWCWGSGDLARRKVGGMYSPTKESGDEEMGSRGHRSVAGAKGGVVHRQEKRQDIRSQKRKPRMKNRAWREGRAVLERSRAGKQQAQALDICHHHDYLEMDKWRP